jgi:hypothetical protein
LEPGFSVSGRTHVQTFVEYNSLDAFLAGIDSAHGPNVDNCIRIAQVVKRNGTLPIVSVSAEATYLRITGQEDTGRVLQIHRLRSRVGDIFPGAPYPEEMTKRIEDIARRVRETADFNDYCVFDGSGYSGMASERAESAKR